jgi:hypothetical protein
MGAVKILLSIICAMVMVLSLDLGSAYAEGVTYRANGQLVQYHPDLVEMYPDQLILRGNWQLVIFGEEGEEQVIFHTTFLEENGPGGEEIEGTIDIFKLSFSSVYGVFFEDSKCFVWGEILWEKKGWDVDTGKQYFMSWIWEGLIRVSGSEFTIHHDLIGEPWTIGGCVLSSSQAELS